MGRWRPTSRGPGCLFGRSAERRDIGGRPGWSLEEAIEVSCPREEYEWLELHPCLCGGRWVLECQHLLHGEENEVGSRMTDKLEVACDACGRKGEFYFVVQYEGRLGGEPPETPYRPSKGY